MDLPEITIKIGNQTVKCQFTVLLINDFVIKLIEPESETEMIMSSRHVNVWSLRDRRYTNKDGSLSEHGFTSAVDLLISLFEMHVLLVKNKNKFQELVEKLRVPYCEIKKLESDIINQFQLDLYELRRKMRSKEITNHEHQQKIEPLRKRISKDLYEISNLRYELVEKEVTKSNFNPTSTRELSKFVFRELEKYIPANLNPKASKERYSL
ncbi:MAG: hypothetical protein NT007_00405 [Candidatus Kapabacteria bacterium]|nr:hypothetical protein [Candidatus Kapabacteria bacterium]